MLPCPITSIAVQWPSQPQNRFILCPLPIHHAILFEEAMGIELNEIPIADVTLRRGTTLEEQMSSRAANKKASTKVTKGRSIEQESVHSRGATM